MNQRRLRRRALLAAGTATLGAATALSGCAGGGDGGDSDDGGGDGDGADDGTDESGGTAAGDGTATGSVDGAATTEEPSAEDLDLREANVTGVDVEDRGGGEYRFSVTLYHDDDGEDGYADRWVVERRDGTELGRRELLHAHSTAPFTRSETVAVPDDVDCVVVRGHDQTHGYGGRAALVSLDGATSVHDQGSEPSSFADRDCPE
jgi:hypothetical protein